MPSPGFALTSVRLGWDKSPEANITGYRIHYGVASRTYTHTVNVGNTTNAIISGLADGVIYYFAATSLDSYGLESDYSNEAANSLPIVPNQPPTLNPVSNLALNQNAGLQTLNLSGISSGASNESQVLTITASSSNPGLIPNPTIGYASPNPTGSLMFTPVAHAFGSATIKVTVNDGQAQNNTIVRSFDVMVNGAPAISAFPDQETPPDRTTPAIAFTVSDPETAASNLTVFASSSNPALVPTNNIVFGGTDSNRTVTITPLAGELGEADIIITVSDGRATASAGFVLSVAPGNTPNTPPTISAIEDQTTSQDTPMPGLPFVVSDAETAAESLTLWASSTNPGLTPANKIVFGGEGNLRTVTLTPASGQAGTSEITLYLSDGSLTSSTTFRVTVLPSPPASTGPLTLLVSGNGTISPDLTNQKLVIGKRYTIRAKPAPGQIFGGWTGSATSPSSSLTFVLKSNLVFQANFVPLNLTLSGVGTISPDLRTSQSLVVGKLYTITATPGTGQLLTGWTGTTNCSAQTISFRLTTNVALRAAFIPNPYYCVQGTYNGLFHESDAVRPTSSGSFTLSATAAGGYSGSLRIGAKRMSFSGKLDAQLQASNRISLSSSTTLTLSLCLGTGDQADRISGTLTDGAWVATVSGDRSVFNSGSNLAPYAGAYTLVLPGNDGDPSLPAGDGFGTVRVSTSGVVTFSGTLADGTRVTHSATASKQGFWPLYVPLYSGGGSLISWLTFANQPDSDINGLLSWIKPAIARTQYYPAGFNEECQALGSLYRKPASSSIGVLSLTNANVEFSGGDLASAFTNSIVLGPSSKVTNKSTNALSLTFSLTLGTFTGTVTDPATGTRLPFSGAVFQKHNAGYGLLRGRNQTSEVKILP